MELVILSFPNLPILLFLYDVTVNIFCSNEAQPLYSIPLLCCVKRGVAWILKLQKELLRRVIVNRLDFLMTPDNNFDKSVISNQNLKEAEKAILMFIKQEFPMKNEQPYLMSAVQQLYIYQEFRPIFI